MSLSRRKRNKIPWLPGKYEGKTHEEIQSQVGKQPQKQYYFGNSNDLTMLTRTSGHHGSGCMK